MSSTDSDDTWESARSVQGEPRELAKAETIASANGEDNRPTSDHGDISPKIPGRLTTLWTTEEDVESRKLECVLLFQFGRNPS